MMRAIATFWIALLISVPVYAQEGQISSGKATLVANGVAVDVSVIVRCSVPAGFITSVSGSLRQAFKPTKTVTFGSGSLDIVCDGTQQTIPIRVNVDIRENPSNHLFRQGSALANFDLSARDPDFNNYQLGGFSGTIDVKKK